MLRLLKCVACTTHQKRLALKRKACRLCGSAQSISGTSPESEKSAWPPANAHLPWGPIGPIPSCPRHNLTPAQGNFHVAPGEKQQDQPVGRAFMFLWHTEQARLRQRPASEAASPRRARLLECCTAYAKQRHSCVTHAGLDARICGINNRSESVSAEAEA